MSGRTAGAEYEQWTQEQLISRIKELEVQLKRNQQTISHPSPTSTTVPLASTALDEALRIPYRKPPKQAPKPFDFSKYSTRLIALKFAYLGQKYNGFEHHKNNTTPLPTIEEELWKALVKTRLINPTSAGNGTTDYGRIDRKTLDTWDREGADVNWDGCEYSKCGRTDRGVSAFGQVIGLLVRSNRPLPKQTQSYSTPVVSNGKEPSEDSVSSSLLVRDGEQEDIKSEKPFDDLHDELPYIQLLNRVLPPEIRIYAWCPNPPPNFSARFSCKERRYKYFFTNPCFAPVPGQSNIYALERTLSNEHSEQKHMREGWLDIEAMRQGCKALTGLHDFRNFCKIDASKQLTNFQRRIFHADIEEVSPLSVPAFLSHPSLHPPAGAEQPKMYAFVLHGSAFLWHQVRSIVAILFLIGQGLESASIIPQLLDIEKNQTRPKYEMASDAPLVLWDCIFPDESEVQSSEEREHGYEDRLNWIYVGDEGGVEPKGKNGGGGIGRGKWGRGGVMDDVWEAWRRAKMEETLGALLLDAIADQGKSKLGVDKEQDRGTRMKGAPRVFDGGDIGKAKGNYIPVMKRERQEPVEVVNERYARKKGLDPAKVKPREEDADE